jgi:ribosomal protein S18 acetylase RimI-like enzyme
MKNNLIYRKGVPEDTTQLKQLGLISYTQYSMVLEESSWDNFYKFIDNDDSWVNLIKQGHSVVCEQDNKIVGMAFLIPSGNPTKIYPADWSYIRMVGVDPKFRGKGVGKQLTRMCIDLAQSLGEKVIALHTSEFMDAARDLYENLGFRIIKELDPMFGKRYWLYKLDIR